MAVKVPQKDGVRRPKMRLWKKVLLILFLIPAVLIVALGAFYFIWDNYPDIRNGYNLEIKTGGEIEQRYLQFGSCATKKTTAKAGDPIKKYTIYYPEELEKSDKSYPMILVVNGTGDKATKYEPQFKLFASWGFIIVGTQDKNTGSGQTTITTLNYMLDENKRSDSVFHNKIDVDNIGITGFSQGGAAVFNVLTKYDESKYIKAAAPLSPVSEKTTAEMIDYTYDSSKVKCPIMILAGTEGEFETEIVIPIDELNKQYDKIEAPKVMARRIGMEHDHMMYSAGGYVMAWFMWQLQGDENAAKAFVGENPELMNNELYQDQKASLGNFENKAN